MGSDMGKTQRGKPAEHLSHFSSALKESMSKKSARGRIGSVEIQVPLDSNT